MEASMQPGSEGHRTVVAWRGAMWAAALTALGAPIGILLSRKVPGLSSWPAVACTAFGLVLFMFLFARRAHASRRGAAAAFLVDAAALIALLWHGNAHWALLGARWAPFQANKLGAFIVGLLTPELWVGVVAILGYGLSAVLQWSLFAPEVRASLAVGEPAITLVFMAFGLALLVQSLRRFALERRLVRRQEEAVTLERLARALLAVRDLTNTPVQTIEFTAALLRARNPELGPALERLDRAIASLHELNHVLADYEADVEWHPGGESFDAREVLRRANSSTEREVR
jgi:hypothetical protein